MEDKGAYAEERAVAELAIGGAKLWAPFDSIPGIISFGHSTESGRPPNLLMGRGCDYWSHGSEADGSSFSRENRPMHAFKSDHCSCEIPDAATGKKRKGPTAGRGCLSIR